MGKFFFSTVHVPVRKRAQTGLDHVKAEVSSQLGPEQLGPSQLGPSVRVNSVRRSESTRSLWQMNVIKNEEMCPKYSLFNKETIIKICVFLGVFLCRLPGLAGRHIHFVHCCRCCLLLSVVKKD